MKIEIQDKVYNLIYFKFSFYLCLINKSCINFDIANSVRPSVYDSVRNSIDDQLQDDLKDINEKKFYKKILYICDTIYHGVLCECRRNQYHIEPSLLDNFNVIESIQQQLKEDLKELRGS